MPDFQSSQSFRDIIDDSGIMMDEMERPARDVTSEFIRLHLLEDTDTGTQVPFFSRATQWAYSTQWYSNENFSKWLQNVEADMDFIEDRPVRQVLRHALYRVAMPVMRVLVARNHNMTATAADPKHPGFHLASGLEVVLDVPRTLSIISKNKTAIHKQWTMTHLLTVLLDRLMWNITLTSLNDRELFPSRSLADDATIHNALHPQVFIEKGHQDSVLQKAVGWHQDIQVNWLKITSEFVKQWSDYKQSNLLEEEGENADEDATILQRLYRRNIILRKRGALFPAMCAIHNAALAIASFDLVRW